MHCLSVGMCMYVCMYVWMHTCMYVCMYVHRQDSCLMGQYKETLPGRLILLVMASPGGSSKGACCGLASAAGPPPTVWETQPPFSAETNSIGPSAVAVAPRHAAQCLGIVILDMSEIGVYHGIPNKWPCDGENIENLL